MIEQYISKKYRKYLCNCVRPYVEKNFINGLSIETGIKLTDQLVKNFYSAVRHPYHKGTFDNSICCNNQPERSKREDSHTSECIPVILHDCCMADCVVDGKCSVKKKCEMRCSEHCGNTVREVQKASSPKEI